jgi:hypothetical protein
VIARKRATGPRELAEILRQARVLSAGADTADNRYGSGLLDANNAMDATSGLWKAVRYGSVPGIGDSVAISGPGWPDRRVQQGHDHRLLPRVLAAAPHVTTALRMSASRWG